jgi:hypothetical protein
VDLRLFGVGVYFYLYGREERHYIRKEPDEDGKCSRVLPIAPISSSPFHLTHLDPISSSPFFLTAQRSPRE